MKGVTLQRRLCGREPEVASNEGAFRNWGLQHRVWQGLSHTINQMVWVRSGSFPVEYLVRQTRALASSTLRQAEAESPGKLCPDPHARKWIEVCALWKIYLFITETESTMEREREMSHCWFIPQIAATAKAEPGWNQEPGGSSRPHSWVAGGWIGNGATGTWTCSPIECQHWRLCVTLPIVSQCQSQTCAPSGGKFLVMLVSSYSWHMVLFPWDKYLKMGGSALWIVSLLKELPNYCRSGCVFLAFCQAWDFLLLCILGNVLCWQ